MKAIFLGIIAMMMTAAAVAQTPVYPVITPVSVAPTGACTQTLPIDLKTPDGTLYTCQNGTWGQSGGSTSPGGSHFNLQFNNGSGGFGGDTNINTDGSGNLTATSAKAKITDNGGQVFNVLAYGAKCDGVTDDTTAENNAIAAAVAATSSGATAATVQFPAGTCRGLPTVTDGKFINFQSSGSTTLLGIGSGPALQVNGLWYSQIKDFQFKKELSATVFIGSISGTTLTVTAVSQGSILLGQSVIASGLTLNPSSFEWPRVTAYGTGTGGTGTYTIDTSQTVSSESMQSENATLEIDGNYDGSHTQGVQFDTFTNDLISGRGTNDGLPGYWAVSVCRQSAGACQGSNLNWMNDSLSGTAGPGNGTGVSGSAVYQQIGFNALANPFIGGDFQDYTGDGANIANGSADFFATTFETTHGCAQLLNSTPGFDINAAHSGAGGTILEYGVRTEGWSLSNNTTQQRVDIRAPTQASAFTTWGANGTANLNDAVKATDSSGIPHLYCVTTAGTFGPSQGLPWPSLNGQTVTNGTAVLTNVAYNFFVIGTGSGSFDIGSAVIDSSAGYSWNESSMAAGNPYPPLTSTSAGLGFHGINGGSELWEVSQGATLSIFTNPNAAYTSIYSGNYISNGLGFSFPVGYDIYYGNALVDHWNSGTPYLQTYIPLSINGDSSITAGPRAFLEASTGNLTGIVSNGQYHPFKVIKPGTIENIEATASAFTCSVNPVITLEDCGTSAGTCSSPSALGSATLTAANTITDGTVSSATMTAGHYLVWETTAGTCTVLNISASAEYRMN